MRRDDGGGVRVGRRPAGFPFLRALSASGKIQVRFFPERSVRLVGLYVRGWGEAGPPRSSLFGEFGLGLTCFDRGFEGGG